VQQRHGVIARKVVEGRGPRRRRRLRQLPRWETPVPRGVRGSYGPAVVAWGWDALGIDADPWQEYALNGALRYDRHGDLVARLALVSTARQQGKTVIVRLLMGWILAEGHKLEAFAGWEQMLTAAHDARQARIPYNSVLNDLAGSRYADEFALTRLAGIRSMDGALTLDTSTAQPGSQRGSSNGLIAWDEVLTQRSWDMYEVLSPTQSAQRSPLMLMTSTAGHPDSVVLRALFDRTVRIAAGDEKPDPTFYAAWWAATEPTPDLDWAQVARANPALGKRVTRRAITSEHSVLPEASWVRERLNLWPESVVTTAFSAGLWGRCRVPSAPLDTALGPFSLGISVAAGWLRATIAVAGERADGRIGVEVFREFRGSEDHPVTAEQITAAVTEFAQKRPPAYIAYDLSSGIASALGRHSVSSGLNYDPLKPSAVVSGCMDLGEMLTSGRLAHNDPLFDYQLPMAAKRFVGSDGAWRWGVQASAGDIDAVIALTMAAHAAAYRPPVPGIF
jgi:hypothetical protein